MTVFLTGANGYIGRSVIRELRGRAHRVRALVRSDAAAAVVRDLGAEPVLGDMRDLGVLRAEAATADAIVHCAQEMSGDNAAITRAAIETMLAAAHPGATFIYTSGVWVYGSRGDAVLDEAVSLEPLALVAWRPAIETMVLDDARVRGIVIRPGIVYGDGGGIPGAMSASAAQGPVAVVGDGANRWPTVRHDALAELFALAIDTPAARGVYNATHGPSVPYVEIARAASRAGGGDGAVLHRTLDDARSQMGPFADALAADQVVDSGRAERELGWAPHRPTLLEELSNTTVV